MLQPYADMTAWEQQAVPQPRAPLIVYLVAVFVLITASASILPVWNLVVKGLGVLLVLAYSVRMLRTQLRPCGEVFLYVLWTLWSLMPLLAGNVPSVALFQERWLTCIQVIALILVLTLASETRAGLTINLGAFLIAAIVVGGYSMYTGEYQMAEATHGRRVEGLALNANAFAYTMFLGIMVMAYLWIVVLRRAMAVRIALAVGMLAFALAILASGSRKATVGAIAFVGLWMFLCYRRELIRRPGLLLGVLLALAIGGGVFASRLERSVAGERLASTFTALRGGYAKDTGGERLALYRTGLELVEKHPFVGIGQGGFRIVNPMWLRAHSEYVEVATATGLPGLCIYCGILVVFWLRTGRIVRNTDDLTTWRITQFARAVIIVMALLALGRDNYESKHYWIVMASLMGYTHAVWQDIKARRAYAQFEPQPTSYYSSAYVQE